MTLLPRESDGHDPRCELRPVTELVAEMDAAGLPVSDSMRAVAHLSVIVKCHDDCPIGL